MRRDGDDFHVEHERRAPGGFMLYPSRSYEVDRYSGVKSMSPVLDSRAMCARPPHAQVAAHDDGLAGFAQRIDA